jgi:hypothetical protein
MPVELTADPEREELPARSRGLARVLLSLAGLFFLGAGALLWWRHGAAVFSDYVLGALAWCF